MFLGMVMDAVALSFSLSLSLSLSLLCEGYILLYFLYVTIVILGRLVYQKWKKRKLGSGDIPSKTVNEKLLHHVCATSTVIIDMHKFSSAYH